jgi:hypothetical protein
LFQSSFIFRKKDKLLPSHDWKILVQLFAKTKALGKTENKPLTLLLMTGMDKYK